MNIARIAAQQKRLKSWQKQLQDGVIQDPEIREKLSDLLNKLAGVLNSCFSREAVGENDTQIIEDLERQIELLDEEGRLKVVGNRKDVDSIPALF